MKRRCPLRLFVVLFLLATGENIFAQHATDKNKTYAFENGQWFDGKGFVNKTMYVKEGIFTGTRPAVIDTVINLQNKFVVPPYSESHTHHLEGVGAPPEELIDSYLKDGVFYVKNPNNIRFFTKNIIDKLNKPNSIDASFGNGGLTISEGHPMILFEDQIRPGIELMTGKTERGWFNGKAYYTINNEKDLEDKWQIILADKPDFIKTYLINSEDRGKTSPLSKYKLREGLDPAILPAIVAKAHKAGLRVAIHVETANDFRLALLAGVDELAHMPGFYLFDAAYSNRYQLTEEDAKLAAAKNVFIVTTLMTRSLVEDKSLLPIVKENQKRNLMLLKKWCQTCYRQRS